MSVFHSDKTQTLKKKEENLISLIQINPKRLKQQLSDADLKTFMTKHDHRVFLKDNTDFVLKDPTTSTMNNFLCYTVQMTGYTLYPHTALPFTNNLSLSCV